MDSGSSFFHHPRSHSDHPEAQLSWWGQGGGRVSSGQTCGGLLIVWLSGRRDRGARAYLVLLCAHVLWACTHLPCPSLDSLVLKLWFLTLTP